MSVGGTLVLNGIATLDGKARDLIVDQLKVDLPFSVALRDRPTGAVVFVARVEDPSTTR